jgi:uncharacterized protein YjgD (DUF1641 family)
MKNKIIKILEGYEIANEPNCIDVEDYSDIASDIVAFVVKAIRDEPELPDEMPDEIFEKVRNDKDALTRLFRTTVRETKRGILIRLMSKKNGKKKNIKKRINNIKNIKQ